MLAVFKFTLTKTEDAVDMQPLKTILNTQNCKLLSVAHILKAALVRNVLTGFGTYPTGM
jgi:hypothetical protein